MQTVHLSEFQNTILIVIRPKNRCIVVKLMQNYLISQIHQMNVMVMNRHCDAWSAIWSCM